MKRKKKTLSHDPAKKQRKWNKVVKKKIKINNNTQKQQKQS